MQCQVGMLGETPAAHIALKGFAARVDAVMSGEIPFLCKGFAALRALERFLTCMNANVVSQI